MKALVVVEVCLQSIAIESEKTNFFSGNSLDYKRA